MGVDGTYKFVGEEAGSFGVWGVPVQAEIAAGNEVCVEVYCVKDEAGL